MTTKKALTSSVVGTPTAPRRLDQGETVPQATDHIALSSGTRGLLATWVLPCRPEVLIGLPVVTG